MWRGTPQNWEAYRLRAVPLFRYFRAGNGRFLVLAFHFSLIFWSEEKEETARSLRGLYFIGFGVPLCILFISCYDTLYYMYDTGGGSMDLYRSKLRKRKLIEKENKYKKGKNPLSSIVNVNEIGNVKTCWNITNNITKLSWPLRTRRLILWREKRVQ